MSGLNDLREEQITIVCFPVASNICMKMTKLSISIVWDSDNSKPVYQFSHYFSKEIANFTQKQKKGNFSYKPEHRTNYKHEEK